MTEARATKPAAQPPPAAEVLRLATAYQASRALYVATKLGVPDLLADGSRSADDLAAAIGAHAPSLRRLMRALAAFGVLAEGGDGRFALGALGGCLRADAPGSVRALILMYGDEDFWRTWGELEHCIEPVRPRPSTSSAPRTSSRATPPTRGSGRYSMRA